MRNFASRGGRVRVYIGDTYSGWAPRIVHESVRTKLVSRIASRRKSRLCAACARSVRIVCTNFRVRTPRDEQMAAVRVPLIRPPSDDVDAGACFANEQMAACNTRSSSSSSPSPLARLRGSSSTFYVSPARTASQRAHLHLHLPRTMRHDSAAVQSMAGRAYHATSIDSSGRAAVLVSRTVG